MLTVYLTHTPDALANYYGEEALAALRRGAEVPVDGRGRPPAGGGPGGAARGGPAPISYPPSPGAAGRGHVRTPLP